MSKVSLVVLLLICYWTAVIHAMMHQSGHSGDRDIGIGSEEKEGRFGVGIGSEAVATCDDSEFEAELLTARLRVRQRSKLSLFLSPITNALNCFRGRCSRTRSRDYSHKWNHNYTYAMVEEKVVPLNPVERRIEAEKVGEKPSEENRNRASRSLSNVLRHDNKGEIIRPDGWALIDKLNVDIKNAIYAVIDNNKDRYAIGRGELLGQLYLRAKQGHSIRVDLGWPEIVITAGKCFTALHGTTKSAWKNIQVTGLKRMERQHIHMAKGLNAISGMRDTAEIVIKINVEKALHAGIKFYESENGVILSEGIDDTIAPEYFQRIFEVKSDGTLKDLTNK